MQRRNVLIFLLLFGIVVTYDQSTSLSKEEKLSRKEDDLTACSVTDEQGLCLSRGTCFKTPDLILDESEECIPGFEREEDVGCIRQRLNDDNYLSWQNACKKCAEMHLLSSLATNETLGSVKKLNIAGVFWIASPEPTTINISKNNTLRMCDPPLTQNCTVVDMNVNVKFLEKVVPCDSSYDYVCEIPDAMTMSTTCKCPKRFTGKDCRFNTTNGQTEGSLEDFGGANSFQCESDEYLIVEYAANNFSQPAQSTRCRWQNVLPLLRSWCQGKNKCNLSDSANRENCTQLIEGDLELRVNCYPESALECPMSMVRGNESGSLRCYYKAPTNLTWAHAKSNCSTLGGWVAPIAASEHVNLANRNESQQKQMWFRGSKGGCQQCTVPSSNSCSKDLCDDHTLLSFACSLPPRVSSAWMSPPKTPRVDELRRPSAKTMSAPHVFPSEACKTGPNKTEVPPSTTEPTESIRPQFPFAFTAGGEIQSIIVECEDKVYHELPIVLCVLEAFVDLTDNMDRLLNVTDALNTTFSLLENLDGYLLDSPNPSQVLQAVNLTIRIISNLLDSARSGLWKDGPTQALELGRLFLLVEVVGLQGASHLPTGQSMSVIERHLALLLMNVASETQPVFRINASEDGGGYITLGELPDGPAVFQRYTSLASILSKDYFLRGMKKNLSLGPEALGLGLSNRPTFSPDVIIAFERKSTMILEANDTCLFFNVTPSEEAFLDYSGCWLHQANDSHVICRCNHLTTFAMLTNWRGVKILNDPVLQVMTWIGCVISIFCLLACITAFSLIKSVNGVRNIIHRNLCWCLLVGNIALLAGLRQTDTSTVICMAVAILLHFVYLAAFCWMLVEGVQIMRMVITVFHTEHKLWTFYLAGYGLPASIVALAVTISYSANIPYVMPQEVCWLNSETHMIWSFLGPVAVIITLNIITLIVALHKSQSIKTKSNDGNVKRVRNLARGLLVLAPLLGVTWLFGFLFLDDRLIAFAYIFTVLNSLQGAFIFIFHFLFNEKVRDMVRTKAQRMIARKGEPRPRHLRAVSSVTSMMTSSQRTTSTCSSDSRRELSSSSSHRF